MTALQLYKFINDNDIEWHKHDNEGVDDILIFPNYYELERLNKIMSSCVFDDGGIECRLKDGYVTIWMNYICEYHGIDIDEIFIGDYV